MNAPGEKHSQATIEKHYKGEQNGSWKGDNVKYRALHSWVGRVLGKPSKCDHCGNTKAKRYEWANRSRKYKRSENDWVRLCTRCHKIFDGHIKEKPDKKCLICKKVFRPKRTNGWEYGYKQYMKTKYCSRSCVSVSRMKKATTVSRRGG